MEKVNWKLKVIPKSNERMVTELLQFGAGGSRDPVGLMGLAHLLEHILANWNTDKIMKIRYLGGERIAQTTFDFMRMIHYVPKKTWKQNLKLLFDYLYKTDLSQYDIEEEKKFIKTEIRHWNVSPISNLIFEVQKGLFGNSPYANRVMGKTEDIERITLSDLDRLRKSFWDDILIVVSGNVKEEEVKREVKDYFKDVRIEKDSWDLSKSNYPESRTLKKEIKSATNIHAAGVGYMYESPNLKELASLYLLGLSVKYSDSVIIDSLKKVRIPVSRIFLMEETTLMVPSFIAIHLILERNIKKFPLEKLWNIVKDNFKYFKEKSLIYQKIKGLWEETVHRGRLLNYDIEYDELLETLKQIDKEAFFDTYKNLSREVAVLTGENER